MNQFFSFKNFLNPNLPIVNIPKEPRATVLTKSRFMSGLKCDLLLWNQYHSENTLHYSPRNESNLHRMNIQNDSVLISARALFPDGIEIPKILNMHSAHKKTQELIKERQVIFDASFLTTEFFSKTDILIPSEKEDHWEIIEVKPSINIKRNNVKDVSFQLHVANLCGLKINNCSILNLNPNYLFMNELDLSQFFIKISIIEKIKFQRPEFLKQLAYFKSLINKNETPEITESFSCTSPKQCNLKTCWEALESGDLFQLREGGELVQKFYNSGIRFIKDIPDHPDLSVPQKIQIECSRTNTPYVQNEKLKDFIDSLNYPLYFLDFETVNPAMPLYFKSKPYQHIPFLYSLHIQENENSELQHFTYIDSNNEDPRFRLLEDLSKLIGKTGTIICYNDNFEKRCLKESIQLYPHFSEWYSSISENFKDLSDPFKYFYYYHPDQKGSASLKGVLPALTGLDYKDLGINDGNMANLEFLRIKTMNLPKDEIEKIQELLIVYCKMDTFAMYKIIDALRKLY